MTHTFCPPLTHGGCWHKQLVASDFWWFVARRQTQRVQVRFSVAVLTYCASYQTASTEGGFHFGGDVSPSLFGAVAAQVEHDAKFGNTFV